MCEAYTYAILTENVYTRKELVAMESSIVEFHQNLYITETNKILFRLPHVRIVGMYHCGNTRQEAFKSH